MRALSVFHRGQADVRISLDGVAVTMPAPRLLIAMPFALIWLVGWIWAERVALGFLWGIMHLSFGMGHIFMLLWLTAWTTAGAYVLYALLWWVVGREELTVTSAALSLDRCIGPFRRRRAFVLESLHSFAFDPLDYTWWAPGGLTGSTRGSLVVAFGGQAIRFGAGVTDAEAIRVWRAITDVFPQLTARDAA